MSDLWGVNKGKARYMYINDLDAGVQGNTRIQFLHTK